MTGAVFARRPSSSDFAAELFESRLVETVERAFAPDARMLALTRHLLLQGFQAAPVRAMEVPRVRFVPAPRAIAFGAAASLVLMAGGGLVAANDGPGQALYGARLSLEALTLPAAGTHARTLAELDLMDARLVEAQGGAARENPVVLSAALDAYTSDLLAINVDATEPGSDTSQVASRLLVQAGVLSTMVGGFPSDNGGKVDRVMTEVNGLLQALPKQPNNGAGGSDVGSGGNAPMHDPAGGTGNGNVAGGAVGDREGAKATGTSAAPGQLKHKLKSTPPRQVKRLAERTDSAPADQTDGTPLDAEANAAPGDAASTSPAPTTTNGHGHGKVSAPGQVKKIADAATPAPLDSTVADTAWDSATSGDLSHGKAHGHRE